MLQENTPVGGAQKLMAVPPLLEQAHGQWQPALVPALGPEQEPALAQSSLDLALVQTAQQPQASGQELVLAPITTHQTALSIGRRNIGERSSAIQKVLAIDYYQRTI